MDKSQVLLFLIVVVAISIICSLDVAAGVGAGGILCMVLCREMSETFEGREILDPLTVGPAENDVEKAIEKPGGCPQMPYNQWGNNPGYTNCYQPVAMEFGVDTSKRQVIDEKSMTYGQLAGKRAKKLIDGQHCKNMYYYKKNFDDELAEHEAKRWWGNSEF